MDDGSDNGLRLGWVGSDLQEGVTGVFCLRGRRISRAPSYNIKEKTLSTNDAKKKIFKYCRARVDSLTLETGPITDRG